jgi:hypothetical protein
MTNIARMLLHMWAAAMPYAMLQLLPVMVRTVLPFVQQLQRCAPQLPATETAATAAVAATLFRGGNSRSSSSNSRRGSRSTVLLGALFEMQFTVATFLQDLGSLRCSAE